MVKEYKDTMKKFIIIIPVYNEGGTLNQVALQTIKESENLGDILFLNDGSSDASAQILDNLKKEFPDLNVIHKRKNEGYGASLMTGFNFALEKKYEFIITMDCDEQHQPKDLHRFAAESENISIVSGTRYESGSVSSGNAPEDRVQINRKITQKVNRKYGFHLTDTFCGFKRYRRDALLGNNFSEKGYAFPMEMWAYAKFRNLLIKEIVVDRIYITDDRSFGEDLDKKRKRYRYYLNAWQAAHKKYFGTELKDF